MAKTKRHKSIYQFLEQSGVLESNDDGLIKKAREAYWRTYHREYKREQRGKLREHTITLEKKEEEIFEAEASKHDKTISHFLKEAAFAYIQKEYLPKKQEELQHIEQHLSHLRTVLEEFSDNPAITANVIKSLESLESSVITQKPQCLEDVIRNVIGDKPYYLNTLKQIISEYDY